MAKRDKARWDAKWAVRDEPSPPHPLLLSHQHELGGGLAIDIACGLGQNARWLAENGYLALGLDLSLVALQRAHSLAIQGRLGRRMLFVQVDLEQWSGPPDSVDLICVFRFLDRRLFPILQHAIRRGGLLVYETRHLGIVKRLPDANPDYLLGQGELLDWFGDWHVLYHDEGSENTSLVVRKPA